MIKFEYKVSEQSELTLTLQIGYQHGT